VKGITLNIEFDPEVLSITAIKKTGDFRSYTYTGVNKNLKILTAVAGGYLGEDLDETEYITFEVTRLKAGATSLKVNEYVSPDQSSIFSNFTDVDDNSLAIEPTELIIE
jgi:hypothetical protein